MAKIRLHERLTPPHHPSGRSRSSLIDADLVAYRPYARGKRFSNDRKIAAFNVKAERDAISLGHTPYVVECLIDVDRCTSHELGDGCYELTCVLGLRCAEELLELPLLADFAILHHDCAIAQRSHYSQVVTHEHQGHAKTAT